MSRELYVVLLALFRLRAVAMFLDPSAGRDHIERCCALQPPRALIAGPKAHLLRLVSPALRSIPTAIALGRFVPFARSWSRSTACAPMTALPATGPDDPALLTFTSGSTGQPKAAVRTHAFLLAQHARLVESLDYVAGEIDLATLPVFVLANLGSGVASVIPDGDLRRPGAIDPVPVLAQIRRHGVSRSTASPAFFERLARHCAAEETTLPTLRKLFTGGAPVFPRLLDQLHRMAPAARIEAVYGSTEAEPIAHLARDEMSAADLAAMRSGRGLLAGKPIAKIELRILRAQQGPIGPHSREQFEAECRPANEPGEIVVTGDHVLKGYLHGRGDEETKFRVGDRIWHRTGDAGCLDEPGGVGLLGRSSATIADARGTLHPFAAECVAYDDPRVRRAALVAQAGPADPVRRGVLGTSDRMSPRLKRVAGVGPISTRFARFVRFPSIPGTTRRSTMSLSGR